MKRMISLLFIISFVACQNSGDKNKTAGQENIKDTAVNVQTYIALGGEEQYVEITGASSKNPVLLFYMAGRAGRKPHTSGILMQT